jgi:hypothetical protein
MLPWRISCRHFRLFEGYASAKGLTASVHSRSACLKCFPGFFLPMSKKKGRYCGCDWIWLSG